MSMSYLEKTTSHGAIVRWKSPLEGIELFHEHRTAPWYGLPVSC